MLLLRYFEEFGVRLPVFSGVWVHLPVLWPPPILPIPIQLCIIFFFQLSMAKSPMREGTPTSNAWALYPTVQRRSTTPAPLSPNFSNFHCLSRISPNFHCLTRISPNFPEFSLPGEAERQMEIHGEALERQTIWAGEANRKCWRGSRAPCVKLITPKKSHAPNKSHSPDQIFLLPKKVMLK